MRLHLIAFGCLFWAATLSWALAAETPAKPFLPLPSRAQSDGAVGIPLHSGPRFFPLNAGRSFKPPSAAVAATTPAVPAAKIEAADFSAPSTAEKPETMTQEQAQQILSIFGGDE